MIKNYGRAVICLALLSLWVFGLVMLFIHPRIPGWTVVSPLFSVFDLWLVYKFWPKDTKKSK